MEVLVCRIVKFHRRLCLPCLIWTLTTQHTGTNVTSDVQYVIQWQSYILVQNQIISSFFFQCRIICYLSLIGLNLLSTFTSFSVLPDHILMTRYCLISACILVFVCLVFCVSLCSECSDRLKEKKMHTKINVTGAFFQCMFLRPIFNVFESKLRNLELYVLKDA